MRERGNTRIAPAVGLAAGLTLLAVPTAFGQVAFDWATIGNAGNAVDPTTGFGAVAEEFRMATTEVTNAQYAEFLNAVAATDNFGGADPNLYNASMVSSTAGVIRSGAIGSYTYAVVPGRENNPVVYTSFIDAMRFTNWRHNGQGTGGTESGVYNITDGASETRAPGAQYFLPSEDEWYKGAYFQPASEGGDSDDYWLYPTSSNSVPVAGVDANFSGSGVNNSMPIGSYAANFYGLFDMGGNVWEWNEGLATASWRVLRSGSWGSSVGGMVSSFRNFNSPSAEDFISGFRVASVIPGPGSAAIMAVGVSLLLGRRRG